MADTATRRGGSTQTVLYFGSSAGRITPIVHMRGFTETEPAPVAQYEFVHPFDHARPSEILQPMAVGGGTITTNLIETWSENSFNRLGMAFAPWAGVARGGEGSRCDDMLDIIRALSQSPQSLFLMKVIATPAHSAERLGGARVKRRARVYMNAKLVEAPVGDTNLDINTLSMEKPVTFAYTHFTTDYRDASPQPFPVAGRPQGVPAGAGGVIGQQAGQGTLI